MFKFWKKPKKEIIEDKKEPEFPIKQGQIWIFTPTPTPFPQDTHSVEIKDYKEGYINYRFLSGFMFQNEIKEEKYFRYMYTFLRDKL